MRVGLHEAKVSNSGDSGIILLQLCTEDKNIAGNMEKELKAIPNVKVKCMVLD